MRELTVYDIMPIATVSSLVACNALDYNIQGSHG